MNARTTAMPARRRQRLGLGILVASGVALGVGPVAAPAAHAETGAMIVPASGKITGTPGGYCRSGSSHDGFDIAAASGTTVVASADGKVRQADYASSPGNRIVIDHAGGWETRYLHLSSKSVKTGQTVKKGQKIGTVGSTGNSTGAHLHFQVERNGAVIRSSSLLDDFRCGSTVARGKAIQYGFSGLPGGSSSSTMYPKLRKGDRGNDVKRLQVHLTTAGHRVTADGSFGSATDAAVRAFQKKIGTKSDGVVGPKTWGALETAPAKGTKLREGSEGMEVKYLQRGINANLGTTLKVDGKFGSSTVSAVKRYQTSRGLKADAVVGPDTWAKLKGGR